METLLVSMIKLTLDACEMVLNLTVVTCFWFYILAFLFMIGLVWGSPHLPHQNENKNALGHRHGTRDVLSSAMVNSQYTTYKGCWFKHNDIIHITDTTNQTGHDNSVTLP